MGKKDEYKKEIEFDDFLKAAQEEAIKNAIRTFNEGYMLGMSHAKKVFGEKENEN